MVALGVAAFLIFALVTFPARVAASWLPATVAMAGVDGTLWNGRASVVQIAGVPVGSLSWHLNFLALFKAQVAADVKVTRSDGFVNAAIATRGATNLKLTNVTASLPLGSLPSAAVPGGWTGLLTARLARLDLKDGWPVAADGTVEVRELAGPARNPTKMGNYKIVFPPGPAGDKVVGALSDAGGPLEIAGNIQLLPDRSYLVEGSVAPRPEASKAMTDSLQYLGPPDAQGRRPFSLSGTM